MCVCVLGDLSLIFLYCSSSTMVFIPLARPRHYLGRGLQISGQFLDTRVPLDNSRLMQSQRGLDVSDRRSPPLQSASCLQSRPWPQRHRMQLEGSSAHSSVSNTAGERERDVNTPQPLEFESWEGVPESRQAHSPSSSPMLVHRFISAALT